LWGAACGNVTNFCIPPDIPCSPEVPRDRTNSLTKLG
jgi:hypothetical protein